MQQIKKILFIILCVATPFLSKGQSVDEFLDTINRINIKQDELTLRFMVVEYNKDRNSLNENKWYYWFDGKEVLQTEGDYSNRLLDGEFSSFYQNNQIHSKGEYKKGLRVGKWRFWNEDGRLIRIEKYHSGRLGKTRYLLEEDRKDFQKEIELAKSNEEKKAKLDAKKAKKKLEKAAKKELAKEKRTEEGEVEEGISKKEKRERAKQEKKANKIDKDKNSKKEEKPSKKPVVINPK